MRLSKIESNGVWAWSHAISCVYWARLPIRFILLVFAFDAGTEAGAQNEMQARKLYHVKHVVGDISEASHRRVGLGLLSWCPSLIFVLQMEGKRTDFIFGAIGCYQDSKSAFKSQPAKARPFGCGAYRRGHC